MTSASKNRTYIPGVIPTYYYAVNKNYQFLIYSINIYKMRRKAMCCVAYTHQTACFVKQRHHITHKHFNL